MSFVLNELIVKFDGAPVSFSGDVFRCRYFELTNRCDSISRGVVRFSGNPTSGEWKTSLLHNGHSYIGSEALIEYKIDGMLYTLFSGYVSGVTSYNDWGATFVEFTLASPEFWLLSGRNIPTWDKSKNYSDILNEIFSRYKPKLRAYNVEFDKHLPGCLTLAHGDGENDYDYIRRIAQQTASLFFSLDGTVTFKPIEPGYPFRVIKFNNQSVKITSNLVGIPKNISITHIQEDKYQQPATTTESLSPKIGNGLLPSDLVSFNNVGASLSFDYIDLDIESGDTATFLAQCECKRKLFNLVTCEISGEFKPDVKAGSRIELFGFDSVVDNNYILTSVTHKFEVLNNGPSLSSKMVLNSDSIPSIEV